jgi:signal transduction histidine kinase
MSAEPQSPSLMHRLSLAERDSPEGLARCLHALASVPFLMETLNAMPNMAMVLTANRQVLVANQAALRTLQSTSDRLLAMRPGEALGCLNATAGPGGCGTDRHCATCGAVQAVLESQERNGQVVRECRITAQGPSGPAPLDLKVTATPLEVEGEQFVVVVMEDVSQPKRLEILQRVFFHDVLNTAGSISGYAYYLSRKPEAVDDVCERLTRLSQQLVEEIKAQRDLLAAESGDLKVQVEPVDCGRLLDELRLEYLQNPVAGDKKIVLRNVWTGCVCTDRQLLLRVLRNMLKNGLEAADREETVTLECLDCGDELALMVHNPQVMPEEVQLQVFQRSFSTKGHPGRGIGTYSMKLLGEQYLAGKVEFVSQSPEGTTFTLTIPKRRL